MNEPQPGLRNIFERTHEYAGTLSSLYWSSLALFYAALFYQLLSNNAAFSASLLVYTSSTFCNSVFYLDNKRSFLLFGEDGCGKI